MKQKPNRLMAICLALVMVFSGMSASFAAQSFTDVPESHWANAVVEKMNTMGAMPGYDDATFKPAQDASKLEVIVAMYRTVKASGLIDSLDEDALVASYNATLTTLKIPKELSPYGATYPAVAYALENKVIVEDELKFFVEDGKLSTAKKVDTAVFMGKTLNIFKKENLDKVVSFDFKDAFDINFAATTYVNILIEYDVISAKGNADGKFLPKELTSRQLLAAMLSGFYDALDSSKTATNSSSDLIIKPGEGASITGGTNSTTTSTVTGDTTASATTGVQPQSLFTETGTFKGSIGKVYTDDALVEIKDSQGVAKVYDAEKSKIMMNGKALSLLNLEQGQEVTISLIQGNLVQIVIDKDFDRYEGTFVEISKTLSGDEGPYRVLTVREDEGTNKYFKIYEAVEIEKDNASIGIDDMVVGDRIVVNAESTNAKKITVYTKDNQVSGVLNADTDFAVGSKLSVRLDDGTYINQTIEKGFELITRGGEDIRKGDILKVTTEYGKVVKIEGTGMVSEDEGTIKEIIISDSPKLTVLSTSGELKTYPISDGVEMISQSIADKIDVYGLRLGQDVSLDMDAFGIKKLTVITQVEQTAEKVKFSGMITEIYKTTNNMEVKDGAGKVWMIGIKEGSESSIMDFKVGDSVYLSGIKLSDEFFEAELIVGF
ncbi:MAG: S-layer homology domain-containing protein [Clostridia bacterium]|nr:S-layer homology domain-containing protein [Clostridia bacterium]